MGAKAKSMFRKHPWFFGSVAVLLFVLFITLLWPREYLISGQVGDSLKGKVVDLRLMVFSGETSGRLLHSVDYDDVRTTKDGRFDLVHRSSLWHMPTLSYMQICLKTADQPSEWDESLPVCAETPEVAYPTTSNVQGASDGQSAVSCSRRQVTGGVVGVITEFLGLAPDVYDFSLYCDKVYSNTGSAALVEVAQSVSPKLSLVDGQLSVNGGSSIVLPDAEPDKLKLVDNVLSIVGSNSVTLPDGTIGTESDEPISNYTVLAGEGLSGGGTAQLDGTLTLSSALGNSIDSAEIVDSTITFDDIGQNSCGGGQVVQWNGSAWVCANVGVDTDDQTLNLAADILSIADGNSVNLAGYLDNTDSQTLSFNTGTSVLSISNGNTADLSSLLDDTDTLASLSCAGGEVAKWSGAVWACSADNVNDGDTSSTNELQNLFLTIDAPSGTDPVADSTTDVLALADGAGITITGDSGTDTVTIAAVLGTAIDSSEITNSTITSDDLGTGSVGTDEIINGTVANADLANSSLTVTAGTGMSGGGLVSLGSSVTLNAVLGTSVDTSEIVDGTILFADLDDNGCSPGEIIEYDGANWLCGTDNNSSQNLFETIAVPNGTNPVADTSTDTLTLAEGVGVTITGNSATDTVTLAAVLGADITSGEIVDSTITVDDLGTGSVGSDEITNGSVANIDLTNSSLTVTSGAGLSGGGSVSLGGSTTINIGAGNGIVVNADDITVQVAASTNGLSSTTSSGSGLEVLSAGVALLQGCANNDVLKWNETTDVWACSADSVDDGDISSTNELQNLFLTIDAPNGTDPVADALTDTLALADGAGITITGNSGTDTLTIAAVLGVTVESGEITDSTITSDDLGTDSVGTDEIINGTVANADLANSSLTVTAGTGLTGGGLVSLGSSVTLNAALGTSVDTSEIVDGTILFADLDDNGCSPGEIIEYDGANWLCGTDNNSSQNLFETIAVPNGTNPVADSTTDTLTLAEGAGITITGNSGTDTVTLAAVLGTAIDSSEITDGTITSDDLGTGSVGSDEITNGSVANTDLANSSLTVTSGSGLTGGGSVALGGSATINIGAGNGITVNADDITVQVAASADGLSSTTSSGSGLEVLSSGVALLQGCANNDVLKWNETTDVWACGADSVDDGDTSSTNELQNLFLTIDAPNGTDPAADSTTDILALADGAGITITGNSGTDTVTIAAVLGVAIDSSEITDGTITSDDLGTDSVGTDEIINGTVANADLANSSLTVTSGTGLTGGGSVSLGGSTTINIGSGNGITVNADDITVDALGSADGLSSTTSSGSGLEVLASGVGLLQGCADNDILKWDETNDLWECATDATGASNNIFLTIDTPNGTDPAADSTTDTLTLADGAGVTITGNSGTDTVTLAAVLGTAIDSSEITDSTITSDDLGTDSVGTDEIINGTVANGDLANSALTVTAGAGLANGGSVSLGGSTTLNIGAGNGITVNADDITIDALGSADGLSSTTSSGSGLEVLASGVGLLQGCSNNDVLKWNETTDVWACSADLSDDGDTSPTNELQNIFLTIDAPNGTDPAADSTTDILALADGAGVTITGNSGTDTVTIAAVLGTAIDSSEITDATITSDDLGTDSVGTDEIINGTVANGDLVSSSLTVTSGTGLTGGGSVSLGGSATLNIGSGAGITVNADDIAVNALGSADGLSSTTSSGSGLEVLASGVGLLQGCANNDVLKWNETTDVWACSTDLSGGSNSFETINAPSGTDPLADSATDTINITAGAGLTITGNSGTDTLDFAVTNDGLDFGQLADSLTLDATTAIALGASNFTFSLDSTGDFIIQDGANTVFTILDNGSVTIGNSAIDQAVGIDNGTGTISIATDGDANTTNIGTGSAGDTVTIGDGNANVAITDANWSISAAGGANFATLTGAGLADCDGSDDALKWDSTTSQFSCGTNRGTFHNVLDGNYTNATTTFSDVDNDGDATDELGFAVGTSETWVFEASMQLVSNTTADSKWQATAPAGSTCDISVSNVEQAISVSNLACGASSGNVAIADAATNEVTVRGAVTTGGTAGTVMVQFGQNAASGTSTIFSGSFITAYRISGADYAEIYYSNDFSIDPGEIVQLDGTGPSQVSRADQPYSDRQVGIVSSQPGQVIGQADGTGKLLPIALSGRIPIKLTTENGLPKAGDMVTTSSDKPGYGMKAIKSGYVVGQLMVDATDNGDGTASGFVYVRHGYWQAPVTVDVSGILGDLTSSADIVNDELKSLGLGKVAGANHSAFDQVAVDDILRGFSYQQDQLEKLAERIAALETSQQNLTEPDNSLDWEGLDEVVLESSLNVIGELVAQGVLKVDGDAFISGHLYLGSDSAGRLMVRAGETAVSTTFSRAYDSVPVVIITPYSLTDIGYRVKDISRHGFTVELARPPDNDLEFGWQITATSSQ